MALFHDVAALAVGLLWCRVLCSTSQPSAATIPRSILNLDRIDLNCPVECGCQRGYINCTSRHLQSIPGKNRRTNYTASLPHAMWLNDNNFASAISAGNVSDWVMLKTLSLRNCSIRRVVARTFADMHRLAILDLSLNSDRLSQQGIIIDASAFSGTKLEALLLDDNPGISFAPEAFAGATIRSLRIRRCQLLTLSPDVFLPLAPSVESLVASDNSIAWLDDRFEPLFTSISFFDVSSNPWTCDCSVKWLVRVFAGRLNRTRALNPIDDWGQHVGHGLPVPKCSAPRQKQGVAVDALRLDSREDFICSPASVIGIDVDQLRERNETRFRCSASGNPVPNVIWFFPRAEDEYHWAFSIIGNKSSAVSPNAYASPGPDGGVVLVSQAFLTIRNRPLMASSIPSSPEQVRLICSASNDLGIASLMTTFDVTQQTSGVSKILPVIAAPTAAANTARPADSYTTRRHLVPTSPVTYRPADLFATENNLLIDHEALGADDEEGSATADMKSGNETEGTWQGGNVGLAQQSISQGVLVTVAVLVAIVMSSLGGCCLVIACSTSKVPNCPNLKRAPTRYRDTRPTRASPALVMTQQKQRDSQAAPAKKQQDRRPLLKPRYNTAEGRKAVNDSGRPGKARFDTDRPRRAKAPPVNESSSPQPTSTSSGPNGKVSSPPQTFSTFRSGIPPGQRDAPKPLLLNAFSSASPKPFEPNRDDDFDSKRRYNTYYGRHRNTGPGLNLFLSPPPPAPPPVMDGIALGDVSSTDMSRNNSYSYPDGMSKQDSRFLSNSQSELCTCSSDKDKKSSGYRSLVGISVGSDEGHEGHEGGSGATSGMRSSEPGEESGLGQPVACFSPVHGNDIIKRTCLAVETEEITFI